jgi:hypothetical protein
MLQTKRLVSPVSIWLLKSGGQKSQFPCIFAKFERNNNFCSMAAATQKIEHINENPWERSSSHRFSVKDGFISIQCRDNLSAERLVNLAEVFCVET